MSTGRWFDSTAVESAVSVLTSHLHGPVSQISETPQEQKAEVVRNVAFAMGGMTLFLVLVIGALVLFAKREDPNKPFGPQAFLLPVLLIVGAGGAAMYMTAQSQANRQSTDSAFLEIAKRTTGLTAIGGTQLTGDDVGLIPWFQTEELVSDVQWNVRIHLGGRFEEQDLAYVECTHVVDPMGNMTALGKSIGALGLGRQKRLHLRGMDAVVFLERFADLPDLLVVPRMDASSGAYHRKLAGAAHEIQASGMVSKSLSRKYWAVTSVVGGLDRLLPTRLSSLLSERKWCILQVLGGYCVVMTGQRPKSAFYQGSRTEKQILADLQFATQIFGQLKAYAAGASQATSEATVAQVGATPVAVPPPSNDPTPVDVPQSPFAQPQSSLPPTPAPGWSCLGVIARLISAGVGSLLLLGGIVGVCMYGGDLLWGPPSENWPAVQGTIVESSFEERQVGDNVSFRPRFKYAYLVEGQEYAGQRIQFGFRGTKSPSEAQDIEQAYPQGAQAAVRFNPRIPSMATLRTGVHRHDVVVVGVCFSGFILFIGSMFLWLAVRRSRKRLVA